MNINVNSLSLEPFPVTYNFDFSVNLTMLAHFTPCVDYSALSYVVSEAVKDYMHSLTSDICEVKFYEKK